MLVAIALVAVPSPARADPIVDTEARATLVAARLVQLDARLTLLSGKVADAEHRLALARTRAKAGQDALASARRQLSSRRHDLTDLAVQAYMGGGSEEVGALDDLDGQASLASVRDGFVKTVGDRRHRVVEAAAAAERDVSDRADRLTRDQRAAEKLAKQLADQQDATVSALAQETALQKTVDAQLARLIAEQETTGAGEADAPTPAAARATLAAAMLTHLPPAPDPAAAAAVKAALSKVGDPYVWGGSGPDTFDCSGLVMWAWGQAGVSLAHWTGDQINQGKSIPMTSLQPGDLIFMWPPGAQGGPPEHVTMYIGNHLIVQAPHVGGFVEVSSMGWWAGAARAAVRVVPIPPPAPR